MKRFYIVSNIDGCISCTDSDDLALEYALNEDFYVIDSKTGEWLISDGTRQLIPEA